MSCTSSVVFYCCGCFSRVYFFSISLSLCLTASVSALSQLLSRSSPSETLRSCSFLLQPSFVVPFLTACLAASSAASCLIASVSQLHVALPCPFSQLSCSFSSSIAARLSVSQLSVS